MQQDQQISTTPKKPHRFISFLKRRRIPIIIFAFLVLLLVFFYNLGTEDDSFEQNAAYTYAKPELNVEPQRTFSFDANFDPASLQSYKDTQKITDAFSIYTDSALTHEVSYDFTYTNRQIEISPGLLPLRAYDPLTKLATAISEGNQKWGPFQEYFIVQKLNSSGKPLEKPVVTRFTVKQTVQTPVASYEVDGNGTGKFVWAPVPDATKYYVIKIAHERLNRAVNMQATIVGETTKTEWNTTEERYPEEDSSLSRNAQNIIFRGYKVSDDEARNPSLGQTIADDNVPPTQYGVIAKTNKGLSFFAGKDGGELQAQLPYTLASNARKEMGIDNPFVASFDQIPTQLPITMTDGKTVLRPVLVGEGGNVSEGQIISSDGPITVLKVPYRISGTLLTGFYNIKQYNPATSQTEINRIASRNKETESKTGAYTPFTYASAAKDLRNITISRQAPNVPYQIFASNPFTAYLAANLIQGNQYIDVNGYIGEAGMPELGDALNEAIIQNPYILGVRFTHLYTNERILEANYEINGEERSQQQQAIASEVKRVASEIIKNTMSDRQKMEAINNYLTQHGQYDYAALDAYMNGGEVLIPVTYRDAWTPAGILLNKKAVCSGYASAFKLLASQADMEAVVITGIANGSPHAWNKIKVDNAWTNVDATWNDSTPANKYLGLSDKDISDTRSEDWNFVVDAVRSSLATR